MPPEILEEIASSLSRVHQDKIEFHNKEFDKLNNDQKTLTRMMDNLYLDKLKGKISEDDYDRFSSSFKEQSIDIAVRLERLKEAENNYYITAKYLLEVAQRAHELFESSIVEEKRQLLKLVLSNLEMDNEKLLWKVNKPFDLMMECNDRQLWRPQRESNSYFRRERAMS